MTWVSSLLSSLLSLWYAGRTRRNQSHAAHVCEVTQDLCKRTHVSRRFVNCHSRQPLLRAALHYFKTITVCCAHSSSAPRCSNGYGRGGAPPDVVWCKRRWICIARGSASLQCIAWGGAAVCCTRRCTLMCWKRRCTSAVCCCTRQTRQNIVSFIGLFCRRDLYFLRLLHDEEVQRVGKGGEPPVTLLPPPRDQRLCPDQTVLEMQPAVCQKRKSSKLKYCILFSGVIIKEIILIVGI